MTILVTGTIDFDPAKRDDAIAAVRDVMTATRAEDGCTTYTFSLDIDDPGKLWLQEQWRDQEAMDAHMATPHLAALFGKMAELGVTGTAISKWVGATEESL